MLKIETILFPTDFSECSRQAFAHALFLAEQFEARMDVKGWILGSGCGGRT